MFHFLLPIVDHVLRNQPARGGVRAIIVYPMNALINSQEESLKRYTANLPHATPLFVSSRGTRVSYDALEYQWRALCATANLEAIMLLHQLRYTVTTDLNALASAWSAIADLPAHIVGRVLGHKDPRSTRRYAEVSEAQVRAALSRRRK